MKFEGAIAKMIIEWANPCHYYFCLDSERISLNEHLGREIRIEFSGEIRCIACQQKTKKSYSQGYCYLCSQKLARCDHCIVKPEKCHFHLGTCREPEWGKANCFIPHIVYLANTSGVKVGITRETQVPTRWMDQGAEQALPILRVHSRYQAGLMEVAIAKVVSDKTDWRKMLSRAPEFFDLCQKRDELLSDLSKEFQKISGQFAWGDIELLTQEKVMNMVYPVLEYPIKIKSLSLDRESSIEGLLRGIKGQYLILDQGVINIRNHTGYQAKLMI